MLGRVAQGTGLWWKNEPQTWKAKSPAAIPQTPTQELPQSSTGFGGRSREPPQGKPGKTLNAAGAPPGRSLALDDVIPLSSRREGVEPGGGFAEETGPTPRPALPRGASAHPPGCRFQIRLLATRSWCPRSRRREASCSIAPCGSRARAGDGLTFPGAFVSRIHVLSQFHLVEPRASKPPEPGG